MPRRVLILVMIPIVIVTLVSVMRLLPKHGDAPADPATPATPTTKLDHLPSLEGASAWLNGGPLTRDSLAHHPTVLYVWSDTDPLSLEMMQQVQGWQMAYGRYGVRVIGIHAPDFAFAANPAVATSVVRRMHLTFPIALDPEYNLRGKLGGREERPRVIVADASGRVLVDRGADGGDEADRALRDQVRLLHPEIAFPANPNAPEHAALPAEQPRVVFLGTSHVRSGPLAGAAPGRTLTYGAQFRYQVEGDPYVPFPVGRWTPTAEGIVAARGGAANFVAIRSRAERVAAVIGPPPGGSSRVWILADDQWLASDARDVDAQVDARGASFVMVTEPRLYWLSKAKAGVLKLSPDDPGVTFYSFAFDRGEDGRRAEAPMSGEVLGAR
jgi:hypothetical protein